MQPPGEAPQTNIDDLTNALWCGVDIVDWHIRREVCARAEGIADTGQYRDIGVIGIAEICPHTAKLLMHVRGDRVLRVGPVQRDVGDPVSNFISNLDHRSIVRRLSANRTFGFFSLIRSPPTASVA